MSEVQKLKKLHSNLYEAMESHRLMAKRFPHKKEFHEKMVQDYMAWREELEILIDAMRK